MMPTGGLTGIHFLLQNKDQILPFLLFTIAEGAPEEFSHQTGNWVHLVQYSFT